MSDGKQRVIVVVVTYNSEHLVGDLIASLPAGASGTHWRLVVADNDSADDTIGVVRRLCPAATVIPMGRNAGYAAGVNAAVAGAEDFDAVLVLNPDVRLSPGCLSELVAALQAPRVGIAVPSLEDRNGKLIFSLRREPTALRAFAEALLGAERAGRRGRLGETITDPAHYDAVSEADWAEGSTQLISAACLAACGPWDESYFLYSEETEFHLRAGDHGFGIRYVPTAHAVHLEGGSDNPRLWSLLQMNRVRLVRRRQGRLAASAFWVAVVLREGSRALLGRRTSRAAVRSLLSPTSWRTPPGPALVHACSATPPDHRSRLITVLNRGTSVRRHG